MSFIDQNGSEEDPPTEPESTADNLAGKSRLTVSLSAADLSRSYQRACERAELYTGHPAFSGLVYLIPAITIPTILFSAWMIWSGRHQLKSHPIPNALLISGGFGALLSCFGFLGFWALYLLSVQLNAPCMNTMSNLRCNMATLSVTVGIAVFNLSILGIAIERAYLTKSVNREVIHNQAASIMDFNSMAASARRPNSGMANEKNQNRTAVRIVLGLWGSVTGLGMIRIAALRHKYKPLPVCSLIDVPAKYFIFVIFFMAAGNVASFLLTLWTKFTCKAQLQSFAISQAHMTLGSRVALRYTIRISEMLYPSLLFASIWQLIATLNLLGFFLMYGGDDRGNDDEETKMTTTATATAPHLYAIIQHYQSLLLCFPPMLIFALISLIQRSKFDRHGASLFVRLNSIRPATSSVPDPSIGPSESIGKKKNRNSHNKNGNLITRNSNGTVGEKSKEKAPAVTNQTARLASTSNGYSRKWAQHRNSPTTSNKKDTTPKNRLGLTAAGELRFNRLETAWQRNSRPIAKKDNSPHNDSVAATATNQNYNQNGNDAYERPSRLPLGIPHRKRTVGNNNACPSPVPSHIRLPPIPSSTFSSAQIAEN